MMIGPWGGYKNGQIPQQTPPLVQMVPTNPNSWAHPALAIQFERMDDACYAATGYRIGVVEVYRELGVPADRRQQVASKTSTGSSNQWYQQGREDRGETTAATPGTSNHGWALAEDIAHYYIPEVWAWMLKHAHEFGFSWATGQASGEKWHWEYVGTLDLAALGITTTKGTDMQFRIIQTKASTTSANRRYSIFTDLAVLENVPYAEALAYQKMAFGEADDKSFAALDGTKASNAARVADTRRLWERIIDSNLAALRSSAVVVDPAALAAALGPFLASDADINAAVATILAAMPKTGTITLKP